MTSVYYQPPDKRTIRVDGTSNCLHQLSIHFRKLSSSSRGSVHHPWWSTRLRSDYHRRHLDDFTSLALPTSLKTPSPKSTSTNVQMTCDEYHSAQCHITRSFPGLYRITSEVTVPTSRYLRIPGTLVGLPFTLPTRVKITIFSKS